MRSPSELPENVSGDRLGLSVHPREPNRTAIRLIHQRSVSRMEGRIGAGVTRDDVHLGTRRLASVPL
jgi:hypothetical protein